MKYLGLIAAGLWRKPARMVFTLLSIIVAFLLFGVLQGVNASFNHVADAGRLDVLITANPGGLLLPMAQKSQIEAIAGVTAVTYRASFVGFYQSASNVVPISAVDPQHALLTMPPDSNLPDSELAEFKHRRTGALISARLAQKLHWQVGDNGTVQLYIEKIADAAEATAIGDAIDGRFVNSANQTHTDTERGYAQAALNEIGDLEFFVDAIVGAAFATLLLLTSSNMMQSFRERTQEFAVLKTIGFTDWTVAALVLCEATLLCVIAAGLGMLLAAMLLRGASGASYGDIPPISLPGIVILYGVLAAAGIALASTLPAAWRAKRLTIISALTVH